MPWGNGAVFDIALLESWFDRVDPQKDDQGNDRYPWSFWDVADLRTLVRLSGALMCAPFRLTVKSIRHWPMRGTRSR
ncbi:3'-5' exoribonuclease domain-containing protein [Sodalis praecaptivus]|uniref:3'-5' exoribonuclease domain-containing protein n=1 Tax=Sodalis praecaptivus TaxID=1239307 RepID=UPI0037D9F556